MQRSNSRYRWSAWLLLLSAWPALLAAQSFDGAMSGSWWNANRGGEGQFITFERVGERNVAVLAYFTYDTEGNPDWLVGSADFSAGAASVELAMVRGRGARFGAGFSAGDVEITPAGTVTLDRIACDRMRFRYSGDDSLDFEITRLVGPLNGPVCDGTDSAGTADTFGGTLSGSWWETTRGGEGQFITLERAGNRNVAVLAYFSYDENGAPRWLVGSVDYTGDASGLEIPLVRGAGARFGSQFSPADVITTPAGSVRLEAMGCDALRLRYTGEVSFGLDLERLVGDLVGSECTATLAAPSVLDDQLRPLLQREGLSGDPSRGRELPGIEAPLAQLGKLLFFSKALSTDGDTACASCHHPALGGGDRLALSIGTGAVESDVLGPGRRLPNNSIAVGRNAGTFFNIGMYDSGLFWDSRVESLVKQPGVNGASGGIRTPDSGFGIADSGAGANLVAAQARFPVVGAAEMLGNGFPGLDDHQTRAHLAARIGDYAGGAGALPPSQWLQRFREAFESEADAPSLITFDSIALAIGEYQRSAVFVESPWARYVRGDNGAISESAKSGALVFFKRTSEGGAQCAQCHKGDFFTDEKHHVLGFGQAGPGKGDGNADDFGRQRESGSADDRYAFRTPSLLNVELTAPYGHAGGYSTLTRVFNHYALPEETVSDFIGNLWWCQLAPFTSNPTCGSEFATVNGNSLAALARMQAIRQADPANGMPVIDLAAVPPSAIPQMNAFLRTLTDPCLQDRSCFGRWIPEAEEAPDGLQLNAVDAEGNAL